MKSNDNNNNDNNNRRNYIQMKSNDNNNDNNDRRNYIQIKLDDNNNDNNNNNDRRNEPNIDDNNDANVINKNNFNKNINKNINDNRRILSEGRYNYVTSYGIIAIKHDTINFNSIIYYTKRLQQLKSNNTSIVLNIERTIKTPSFTNDDINALNNMYTIVNNELDFFNKNISYLLIRRKHTIHYVDFIRGKYNIIDLDYLSTMINFMTTVEKNNIKSFFFDELWIDLWNNPVINLNDTDYIESKKKFGLLKAGYPFIKNEIIITLNIDNLLNMCNTSYITPEWGYPKGRKNKKNREEKNLECAIREFQEETDIPSTDINILAVKPHEELYLATNYNQYKHIYYIGQLLHNVVPSINKKNLAQINEISDIGLYSVSESISLLRPFHVEKISIINNIHNMLYLYLCTFKTEYETYFN